MPDTEFTVPTSERLEVRDVTDEVDDERPPDPGVPTPG